MLSNYAIIRIGHNKVVLGFVDLGFKHSTRKPS